MERVQGLGVAITVGPERRLYQRRATVGTATEISHHLAILLATIGRRRCLACGVDMVRAPAAGGDLWANERSMYGDPDTIAERERSISVPFTEIHRISMQVLGPSCTMSIEYAQAKARNKLSIVLPTPPVSSMMNISDDVQGDAAVDFAREWVKVNTAHFLSMSKKIKEALPTSVVLESEWPRDPGAHMD